MSETVQRPEADVAEVSTQTGETLVEVRDLKTYYEGGSLFGDQPVKAVDDVSFSIEKGETLGLVGESGCGKTTLGRTLVRLESATDGTVLFDGTDITELEGERLKTWRRNAQIVFQDPESSLNDRMTVGQIIREPLDVHDWKTPRERRQRVRDLLETVGLQEEHYYRYPHQFSGGQRQRVGIARALALEPEFIVLDEPVSALDVSVQAKILNLLDDLQAEFGLTYLFIAHDLSVVRHICDRTAVMYLGNVMELGETEELFADPANPYTHSLLSAIPEPDPTDEKERITLRGTPPSPRNPPSGCPFSTRCPAKLRPPEFEDVSDEVWSAVEAFKEAVRERDRERQEDELLSMVPRKYKRGRWGPGETVGPNTALGLATLLALTPLPLSGVLNTFAGGLVAGYLQRGGAKFGGLAGAGVGLSYGLVWAAASLYMGLPASAVAVTLGLVLLATGLGGTFGGWVSPEHEDPATIEEVRAELFGDLDVPRAVAEPVDRAVEHVLADDPGAARDVLAEAFDSECDRDLPEDHGVGDTGRLSLCHRHKPEHAGVTEFLAGDD